VHRYNSQATARTSNAFSQRDDGINIRTTGLFHSNVGYDSPFTPIPA
jgi:hypothetical protein